MSQGQIPQHIQKALMLDQELRKIISEYYIALKGMNEPAKAIELMTEHVAILVEMINDIKGGGQG